MIDQLLEKYLETITYKLIPGLDNNTDIFLNPDRNDRTEMFNDEDNYTHAMRFIADDKKKKVYGFVASTLHRDVWEKVGDGRKLYQADDLLVGVLMKNGIVKYESSFMYLEPVWYRLLEKDWKWADKNIRGLSKTLSKEVPQELS
jgi:hypothetical protein